MKGTPKSLREAIENAILVWTEKREDMAAEVEIQVLDYIKQRITVFSMDGDPKVSDAAMRIWFAISGFPVADKSIEDK